MAVQMSPGAHQIPLDDAVSTDVSKAGMEPGMGFSPEMAAAKMSKLKRGEGQVPPRESLAQQALYDWSEVAYLFEDGVIPQELLAVTDPIEYNYLIVRLKKEFNEKHRSDYLRYMHLDLPYHSRRDELGGVITDTDWNAFVRRLEGVIDKVRKKRKRIIRRRKKKGKKLMPRGTLFKPPKKERLDKNPLWREVYMRESSDEDDDSGSEENDAEIFQVYKDTLATKGIRTAAKNPRQLLMSAQSEPNAGKNQDLTLPPIDAHRKRPNKGSPFKGAQQKKMSMSSANHKPAIGSGLGVRQPSKSRGESRRKVLRTAA